MIVDSQCHVSPIWYEPVETLLFQMDRHGVDKAVLIQMLGQFDNDYQQRCLSQYPDRFTSVVGVDASAVGALEQMERLAENGAGGVRLRPAARSPGDDPLAVWRRAGELGLAVSCVGNTDTFATPDFAGLVEALPDVVIVLEHLGGTSTPDSDDEAIAARRSVMDLARYPNVCLKVPGIGELSPRSPVLLEDAPPFDPPVPDTLLYALEKFGSERMMWGSDFPPVGMREGYGNALRWAREAFADSPEADRQAIFGATAERIFFTT